jgi:3-phosphoshikimate 1-carboxyvinyltransferase
MKVTILPSKLSGIVHAPASKSSMQRACAAALLAKGTSIIHQPGHSNDDKASLEVIKALGATVESKGSELTIVSNGIEPVANEVNCGESGLGIRMFAPLIALSEKEITVNGQGSLLDRPMEFFDEVFPQLGVSIQSNNGKLPLKIKGPLQPGNIEIDGSLSSQFLTGLLLAYGASNAHGVAIKVRDLKSRPYIDLTLNVMRHFGLPVPLNKDYKEFYFIGADPKPPSTQIYTVEGDWSGGAFLLVAGAIAGPVTVRGLDLMSTQADKAIVEALISAHAGVAIEAKGIIIRPAAMTAFEFDATDCPDLFPPLVALAAYCKGVTQIQGVSRLIHKESNRAQTLKEEFGKMGIRIEFDEDSMQVYGGPVKGGSVHSHQDHRIAMATTVAGLRAENNTVIESAEAVNKSYPDFFWHLKKLGADVSLIKKKFIHE